MMSHTRTSPRTHGAGRRTESAYGDAVVDEGIHQAGADVTGGARDENATHGGERYTEAEPRITP